MKKGHTKIESYLALQDFQMKRVIKPREIPLNCKIKVKNHF